MGKKIEFLKKATVEGGKAIGKGAKATWEVAKKTSEAVADSSIGKSISKRASEWKNNITETLKMETTEKWKMLITREKEDILLDMKESDIDRVDEEIGRQKGRIDTYKEDFKNIEAKAEEMIIEHPDFEADYRRGVAERKAEMDEKITEIEDEKLVILSKRKDQYLEEKEQYEKRIKSIESEFSDKIDEKIDNVKSGHDYEDKVRDKKVLDEEVDDLSVKFKEKEKKLVKLEASLDKDLLTKEGIGKIREMIRLQRIKLGEQRRVLRRAEKARDKNDRQIGKIDRKTQRLEGIKNKYSLF